MVTNIIKLLLFVMIFANNSYGASNKFNTLKSLLQKYIISTENKHYFPYLLHLSYSGDIALITYQNEQWYMNVISNDGKVSINAKYITDSPTPGPIFQYSSKVLKLLPDGNYGILGRGDVNLYFITFDENGDNGLSKTYNLRAMNPILLVDNNSNFYAISQFGPIGLTFDIVNLSNNAKQIPLVKLFSKEYRYTLQSNCCATISNNNNIFIGFRTHDNNWNDKLVFYEEFDIKGNKIKNLTEIDISKSAYCKIKEFALPGTYVNNYTNTNHDKKINYIHGGFDIIKLNNGQLVMSVTATDDDGESLCTYLLKFDIDGNIIPAKEMKSIKAQPIGDSVYPVNRAGWLSMQTGMGNVKTKYEMVVYSFDDFGNLYAEKIPLGEFGY